MLNGFELCKKIREVDKALYVIFITAAAEYKKFRSQHYTQLTNNTSYIHQKTSLSSMDSHGLQESLDKLSKLSRGMLCTASANYKDKH
jgi:hypothetical protein